MAPISLIFEDGIVYEIDRVLEVSRSATLEAGSCGIRYTLRINWPAGILFFGGQTEWSVDPKHKTIGRWFVRGR